MICHRRLQAVSGASVSFNPYTGRPMVEITATQLACIGSACAMWYQASDAVTNTTTGAILESGTGHCGDMGTWCYRNWPDAAQPPTAPARGLVPGEER